MEIKEIEETNPNPNESSPDAPTQDSGQFPNSKSVRTKVPEVKIHLYKQGKGPIAVFKSSLGGWDEDQLEVREILEKYGLKSVYAYNSDGSGRGAPIRFNPKNGRSLMSYRDGSNIYIDGEPKDSLIKPVTKILFGVTVITILIAMIVKEPPQWIRGSNFFSGSFHPWILVCVVIVFTRMRKRTRDFLKKRGW